jgi:glucoamylase
MWAHAEYIKLLRSVSEGEVFDRVPIVAARYHRQLGRKDLEVWKLSRQVRAVPAGSVLRVVASGHFRLRWSLEGAGSGQGPTMEETDSTPSGLGIGFVDIPTRAGQQGKLFFSFLDTSAWLPGDVVHEVQIKPALQS